MRSEGILVFEDSNKATAATKDKQHQQPKPSTLNPSTKDKPHQQPYATFRTSAATRVLRNTLETGGSASAPTIVQKENAGGEGGGFVFLKTRKCLRKHSLNQHETNPENLEKSQSKP